MNRFARTLLVFAAFAIVLGGFATSAGAQEFRCPPASSAVTASDAQRIDSEVVVDDEFLCLNEDRFQIEVDFETPQGQTGRGQAVALTSDTGYFWFFSDDNVELIIKVLDGCGINGHYWIFAGGLTDVRVTINVTDTTTGDVQTFENPQSTAFEPIQLIEAFMTCDA